MVKIYITAGGTRVDYTNYVTQVQVQDQLNVPSLCTLKVSNTDWQWEMPFQGSYVEVWSEQYQQYYFTGVITSIPELTPLGVTSKAVSGVQWNCVLRCTSDEYLLNNKVVPFIPPFIGMTQGEILAKLADILSPGFLDVTTFVASGDIVPYFEFNSNMSWSQVAKQFADQSYYRYKVLNKILYFQPRDAGNLGISYDDTTTYEGKINPYKLSAQPLDIPILNDIMVIGDTEGGSYVVDYFMGDGYTGSFPLTEQAYRTASNVLLDEEWSGASFNTQNWTVVDPQGNFTVFQGALNIAGGQGIGQTYLLMNNGIELGGTWYFQSGSVVFTSQSTGIIGGLHTAYPYTADTCLLGFLCEAASGGLMTISPIVNGASGQNVTPAYVDGSYLHSYIMAMQIVASQQARYNRKWTSENEVYGGTDVSASAIVTFFIYESDPAFPLNPTMVAWQFSLDSIPEFVEWVPYNSEDLNLSATQTQMVAPPQAGLYEIPYYGTPQQLNRLTDMVQSQVRVEAAAGDGGMLEYTKADRTIPYEFRVWEAVAPTAWQYMTMLQPSYLFSLPGQQQQVGLPQVSHVSIIYPPYNLPPLPGQVINVSVPNVSGANFDLTKTLSWLLAQQDISVVSYGWDGTISEDAAAVNLNSASNAMVFDTILTQYTAGVSGGVLYQPPPSSTLNQSSITYISVAASGYNLTGAYDNLPSAESNWRFDVYRATDSTFYYEGNATVDSGTKTWSFTATGSGSIVVFIVPSGTTAPSIGGTESDPASSFGSIADTNSTPLGTKLTDYRVDTYSWDGSNFDSLQSGLPMVVESDGSLFSMGNIPAASATPVYQIVYTDPSTSTEYVVYDSRLNIPVYDGLVGSYRIPVTDPAFVPLDKVALGAYSIQNRSNTKDNALAIFAFLQNPNNLSPYSPSTGQSTSSQQQAQDCAQVLAGLVKSPQFLITNIREDASEADPSTNWSITGGGSVSKVWDADAPVGGSYVVEFLPSGTNQFTYAGSSWADSSNLVTWNQKINASDSNWYVKFACRTTDATSISIEFVAGSAAPSYSSGTLTVPYTYPDGYWAQEQFDLSLLWASYGDVSTHGTLEYIDGVEYQASQNAYIDSLYTGIANPEGALSKSYDMENGYVDEQVIETLGNAWAAYALSYYTQVTADPSVQDSLESVLSFLASQQWTASGDLRYNLLTAGYDDYAQLISGGGGGGAGTVLVRSAASGIGGSDSTGTNQTTVVISPSAGNTLIVHAGVDSFAQTIYSTFSISDSKGNSYSVAMPAWNSADNEAQSKVWIAKNVAGGSTTITVTLDDNNNQCLVTVLELEGDVDVDTYGTGSGNGYIKQGNTIGLSSSLATTNASDCLLSFAFSVNTIGGIRTIDFNAPQNYAREVDYSSAVNEIRTAVGNRSVDATGSFSSDWFLQMTEGGDVNDGIFEWTVGLLALKINTGSAAGMVSFVQDATAVGGDFAGVNPVDAVFPSSVTSGNKILVFIEIYDYYSTAGYTVSISDSQGNSYSKLGGPYDSADAISRTFVYAADVGSTGANTVTVQVNPVDINENFAVMAIEYSGVGVLDAINGSGTNNGLSSVTPTNTTPSVSTSNAGDVLIAADAPTGYGNNGGNASPRPQPPDGWALDDLYLSLEGPGVGVARKTVGATGSYDCTFSWSATGSSDYYYESGLPIVAMETTGGGGGGSRTYTYTFTPGILDAVYTEDNLVAFMAFSWAAYALGNPTLNYTNVHDGQNYSKDCQTLANEIRDAIQTQLWIDNDAVTASGRFVYGVSASGSLDYGVALADQALGAMFEMAVWNFTRAAACLDFIFQYDDSGSKLYNTGLQVNMSTASASYNEAYEQLNLFNGLNRYTDDPTSYTFGDAITSSWQEGVWEVIAALGEFYTSVQYPYNSVKLPLTQLSRGQRQQMVLGFGQQGQTAAIVSGQNYADTLSFYNDTIPIAQTLIECRYRKSQAAVARVQDQTNIAYQASITGDDGVRGAVVASLSPKPRTSIECEAAAQAKIADGELGQYQGSYTVPYFYFASGNNFPVSGKYLYVNSPKRKINARNFLVTGVTTSFSVLADEIVFWQLSFGQDMYLNKILSKFYLPPAIVRPSDTAQPPTTQQLAEVGTTFIDDLDSVQVTALSGSGATIDVGITPASGIEVRRSDLGWTGNKADNLVGVFTTQQFTVTRSQQKQAWYMRQVNGDKTSRYTTKITVNVQNRPSSPTAQVLWSPVVLANNTSLLNVSPLSPQVSVGLKGNFLDVYGVEVRASDNEEVLYRHQYIATSDLNFQYDNSKDLSRSLAFWVYTFNMLDEYSDGTYCEAALLKPPAPRISVLQISGNAATLGFDQLGTTHPIQNVTVQIAVSGASAFNPPIQEIQIPGQPSKYAVSVGETGIYLIRAKRNDYLGDSDWSSTVRAVLNASNATTASGNLIPNGGMEQWGSVNVGTQTVGLPLGWINGGSSTRGYTTRDPGQSGSYSVGLNVGSFVDPNNYVELIMQQAIAVAPGQNYSLSLYSRSQQADNSNAGLSYGFYVRVFLWDTNLQESIYFDLWRNIATPWQWTNYQTTFTIPSSGDTFVTAGTGSRPIKGTLNFAPGQFYLAFYNYDANVSGAFFVDTVSMTVA